jgi:hypothetical protein
MDFWLCVVCFRIRLTIDQLSSTAGWVKSESGPDKRNRSMLFTSSLPIPIINQMNQSNEEQIATAYAKSIKEFEQNPHQILAASFQLSDAPTNKFEIVCMAGPVSEKISREIYEICKDTSRGKSHFVAALILEARKRKIPYGCNLRALYAVQCDEIIVEPTNSSISIDTGDDVPEFVECIFRNKPPPPPLPTKEKKREKEKEKEKLTKITKIKKRRHQ